MRLTFVNLTNDTITVSRHLSSGSCGRPQLSDDVAEEICSVNPMSNQDTELRGDWNNYVLLRSLGTREKQGGDSVGNHSISKEWLIKPENLTVRISLSLGASWQVLDIPRICPWRMYHSKVCSPCFYEWKGNSSLVLQQVGGGHHNILILPRRDLNSFLAELPDSLPLSALVLPGTHDT